MAKAQLFFSSDLVQVLLLRDLHNCSSRQQKALRPAGWLLYLATPMGWTATM